MTTESRSGVRPRGRLLAIPLALALALATLVASAASAGNHESEVDFVLTVLHNNDGESDLLADAVGDVGFEGGVAYFGTLLRDAKLASANGTFGDFGPAAKRGTVFVSSGDNFLASPTFSASIEDGVFYDAIALDRLGYDAIALGNHDFDFGPDVLADFISEGFRHPGRPPYVSANIDVSAEPRLQALADADVIVERTVVRERGEQIGIIGATTPALPSISSPRGVVVDPDVVAVVQGQIDELTSSGVDKVILISHLQDIDGDIQLVGQLTGLDVAVAGGGDELLADPCGATAQPDCDPLLPSDAPGDVFGSYPLVATSADGIDVPVVTTSGSYGYLGQLVVGFDRHGEVVAIDHANSGPRRVVSTGVGDADGFGDGVEADRKLQRAVVDPVAEYVAGLAEDVIATSEVDLDGRRSTVRSVESNEGNLIADSQLWQATARAAEFGVPEPDVALQNGGGIRNDSIIPAGEITELDTFEMVPFPNLVVVVPDVPRTQFKQILENAVSRTQPGDTPGGTGRFAQIAGFSYTYSESGTAQVLDADGNVVTPGTRVQEVVLDDGTPIVVGGAVVPGPGVNVSTIDFLARGGDEYPFRGAPFTTLGVSYQQALSSYIQAPSADGGLEGLISAADYPAGGEGRIVAVP